MFEVWCAKRLFFLHMFLLLSELWLASHKMQDLETKMHQIALGGRALPGSPARA